MDIRNEFRRLGDEDYNYELLKFDHVENKLSTRPDLCAFLLLDKLVPGTKDMIPCAEHDEIWLAVDIDALGAVATEADVLTLVRCGVRYDRSTDSLAMFV